MNTTQADLTQFVADSVSTIQVDNGSWTDSTKGFPADEPERILKSAVDDTEWQLTKVTENSNRFEADRSVIMIEKADGLYVVTWADQSATYQSRTETAECVERVMRSHPDGFDGEYR